MDKIKQMQASVEQSKRNLDRILVDGKAEGILVKMNGNRRVQEITVDPNLMNDKEALEELMIIAFNRAVEEADSTYEQEMAKNARGLIPGM